MERSPKYRRSVRDDLHHSITKATCRLVFPRSLTSPALGEKNGCSVLVRFRARVQRVASLAERAWHSTLHAAAERKLARDLCSMRRLLLPRSSEAARAIEHLFAQRLTCLHWAAGPATESLNPSKWAPTAGRWTSAERLTAADSCPSCLDAGKSAEDR